MSGPGLDVEMGLADWHSERNYYNFSTNHCEEGQMCGHYTQVVWASTERVGCGQKFCEKVDGFEDGNMYLLVCNYEPPGNFEGQRPYESGPPCSACPPSHPCQGTLCVAEKESSTDLPEATSQLASGTTEAASDTAEQSTASELAVGTTEWSPDKLLELTPDATSVFQPDITSAMAESDTTVSPSVSEILTPAAAPGTSVPPPVPTTDSPLLPDISVMPALPDMTKLEQISDLTPSSLAISSSDTADDAGPQLVTQPSDTILDPSTSQDSLAQSTEKLDVNQTVTESGEPSSLNTFTVSPKPPQTDSTLESAYMTKQPSTKPTSPSGTTKDKAFSNDGPEVEGEGSTVPTLNDVSPLPKKTLHGDISALVSKNQPKDSPAQAVTKTPMLQSLLLPPAPSKKTKKDQKDTKKQPSYTGEKTAQETANMQKKQQKYKENFKKHQLKTNFMSKGGRWGFKSGASEGTYYGNHISSPPFVPTRRAFCPYPCLSSHSIFPLYRTTNAAPRRSSSNQVWPNTWPSPKKPCKSLGYKRTIYSLYMEDNLTEPKS
ncbi:peptidase inhibitor 16-like isoform X2 [Hyperolius riggenbachi]